MSLSISEKAALQDESLSAVENLKGSAAFTQGIAYGLPEQHYSVSSLEEMNVDVAPHRAALELAEDEGILNSSVAHFSQEQRLHQEGISPDVLPLTDGDDLTGLGEDEPILLDMGNLSTSRETTHGSLDFSDYFNPTRLYAFKDDYLLSSATSQTIQINLDSSDFDAYLQLVDAFTGRVLAFDDDGGSGTNAQLNFTVEAGGRYLIRATSYWSYEVGRYSLTTQIGSGGDPVPPEPPEPPSEFDSAHGYGLIDAASAVAAAIGQTRFNDVADVANSGGNQWSNDMVQAPEAWAEGFTGQGVTVAVIDSGVDINHEDLRDNIWVNTDEIMGDGIDNDGNGYTDDRYGWNFGRNQNNNNVLPGTTDPGQSHGTHVAGTIAAGNNGFGITGVAHGADIMAIRMGDVQNNRFVNGGSLAQAIRYAVDNGADVINMSLGWNSEGGAVEQALAYAASRNVITVSAAGNSSLLSPGLPGRYATEYGLVVGAVDNAGRMAGFSNRAGFDNRMQYVTAPGVNIYSTVSDPERYDYSNGTSMAAPHVAGVVALMLSANPNLTHAQVRDILTSTTADMAGMDGSHNINHFVTPDPMPVVPENFLAAPLDASMLHDLSTGKMDQAKHSDVWSQPLFNGPVFTKAVPSAALSYQAELAMTQSTEAGKTPTFEDVLPEIGDFSGLSRENELVFAAQEDWIAEEFSLPVYL